MDRRKSLKAMAVGTISTSLLLDACKLADKKKETAEANKDAGSTAGNLDRQPEEKARDEKEMADKFFTGHEMETIAVLADIIIPADEISGSATDAKVPDFIEFIVKDMPEHQVPMRGGLRWLDMQCFKRFQKAFKDCNHDQQIEIVDDIAYPVVKDKNGKVLSKRKIKPGYEQGTSFF